MDADLGKQQATSFYGFDDIPELIDDGFPRPNEGRVRFYVVTSDRVLMADAAEQDLGYSRATLSPLFHDGHKVMYAFREHAP